MKDRKKTRKKVNMRLIILIATAAVLVAAITAGVVLAVKFNHRNGYLPLINRERYDRSLPETFLNVRPNTIFVFEDTSPSRNQKVFFEHIDEEAGIAQRVIRTVTGAEYIDLVLFDDAMNIQNVFLSSFISRGNHLGTEQRISDTFNSMRGPLFVGQSWRVHEDVGGHTPDTVYSVQGMRARVTVPFGTFHALRVTEAGLSGHNTSSTRYYAPGVGLVKLVNEHVNSNGEIERFELVLVDIIENTGWREPLVVHFPNERGRIERVSTYTTIYTNDNYIENVLATANEYWERHFGFRVEAKWLNNISLVTGFDAAGSNENNPWFNFSEEFLYAMNNVADAETENLILLSIAATLANAFQQSPERRNVRYNSNLVYIAVNNVLYSSDRITLEGSIDVRIEDTTPTLRPPLFRP